MLENGTFLRHQSAAELLCRFSRKPLRFRWLNALRSASPIPNASCPGPTARLHLPARPFLKKIARNARCA